MPKSRFKKHLAERVLIPEQEFSTQVTGGIFSGFIENFGAGSADIFLIKTNVNGDTLWTKTYGGTSDDGGRAVQQTNDGGYIITGFGNDINLLKTDANGNISWIKSFGATNSPEGESVIQTSDGGYFISGDAGLINLIKTDSNGDTIWTRNYNGLSSSNRAYSVQQTNDGGYVVSGYTQGTAASWDFYLLKLNAVGDSLWTRTFGGTFDEQGRCVKQTSDGGYIIAGKTSFSFGAGGDDIYLVRTDSSGNVVWSKTYGGAANDAAYSVQQTNDGGFITVGETQSFGAGDRDVYLVKTDANGTLAWSKTFGGTSWDAGRSVQQTADGGYIIAGFSASFNAGDFDIYLIKTDANGNSGCNEGNPITIADTAATITGSADFTVSSGDFIASPVTITGSGFPLSTLCFSTGINEITSDHSIFISPNPSPGNFIISIEDVIVKGNIEILNILGKSIFRVNIFNDSKKEINLKNISDGIYFVKVFDGEKSYCKKLIVE
jgi:hypothetical protein